jgi:hypothetical protein
MTPGTGVVERRPFGAFDHGCFERLFSMLVGWTGAQAAAETLVLPGKRRTLTMRVWQSQSQPVESLRGVCRFMVASSSVVLAGACGSSKALSPSAAESDAAAVFDRGTAGPGPTPCTSLEGARCPGPPDAAVSADGGSGAASDADAAADDGGEADIRTSSDGGVALDAALDGGAQDAGLLDASTDGTSSCDPLGSITLACPGPGSSAYAFNLTGLPFPLRAGQGYALGVRISSGGAFFIGNVVWSVGPSTDGCTVSAPLGQWTFTGTDIVETVCVKPQQDLTQVIVTRSAAAVGSDGADFAYCGACP